MEFSETGRSTEPLSLPLLCTIAARWKIEVLTIEKGTEGKRQFEERLNALETKCFQILDGWHWIPSGIGCFSLTMIPLVCFHCLTTARVLPPIPPDTLQVDLLKLMEDPIISDVSFTVEGKELRGC